MYVHRCVCVCVCMGYKSLLGKKSVQKRVNIMIWEFSYFLLYELLTL